MNVAAGSGRSVQMVVNADDFGYFDGVSQGIIDAIERGVVTATGVMANGPALARWSDRLRAQSGVSIGVHLNATLGLPLTSEMSEHLAPHQGGFPPKGTMASALLLHRLPVEILLREWRAQIAHCLASGLRVDFVNSHEHIHALPLLYPHVRAMAQEFCIRHVRAPCPEWGPRLTLAGVIRGAALATARLLARDVTDAEPRLIGVSPSGRLNAAYCRWRFPRLAPGQTYELMCHPGREDALASAEKRLYAYHDWQGELALLTSTEFTDLLRTHDIKLVSYADLDRASDLTHLERRNDECAR